MPKYTIWIDVIESAVLHLEAPTELEAKEMAVEAYNNRQLDYYEDRIESIAIEEENDE